jgi:single-stranded-DNA-specific exonuclease
MTMLPLKNWKILNTDTNQTIIDILLNNRGLSKNHLDEFKLSERLHDPYLLKDMNRAVDRILTAIKNRESITIFGDYDVDGVVSTTLMVKLFQKINCPVQHLLPNRQTDGYGLQVSSIKKAEEFRTQLLITVDNGITSVEAVKAANAIGIDVVILDHHGQEGDLPEAVAVVNPNRKGCSYPFKGLCGAGVVYKLFHALGEKLFNESDFKNFMLMHLDLVALATIADVVPLIDENYALVKYGLKSLTQTLRPGIVELKRISGLISKEITPMAVGFYLAPRINVAGRLKSPDIALNLLLSDSREKASELAGMLNNLNTQRQKIQETYINQALNLVEEDGMKNNSAYLIIGEDWEPGLIGIVSGRLKDKFNRPVIAFTRDKDGNYVGSARSTESFHITEALSNYRHLYETYGGHQKAAGLTISEKNLPKFLKEFTAYANSVMKEDDLKSSLLVDTVIQPEQLTKSMVKIIQNIGPFGEGNPEPVLVLNKIRLRDIFPMSQGKHIKLIFQAGGRDFEAVWWRRGELKDVVAFDHYYDVVFKPSINLWNGKENLQLVIEDMQESEIVGT